MKYRAIFDDINDQEESEISALSPAAKTFIVFIIIAIILNLLAIIYSSSCREIYYWSNADYWNMARNIANGGLGTDIWSTVYNSVLASEFNYIPSLLSAVFIRLFGQTRLVFILSLVNLYLFPSIIAIYFLAKKLGKAPLITTLITIFLTPVTIYLALTGFTEIGGFMICLICYCLYFTYPNQAQSFLKHIIIGVLMALLIIWNNWYVFFCASFVTAMIADVILFKKKWYCPVISLLTALALVSFFFEGFIFNRLIESYGNATFDFNPGDNLRLITRYLGLVFLVCAAISSGIIFIKKKNTAPIFIWIQILVCYLSFTAVSTHGQGHLLMYMPSVIVLIILMIKYITKEQMLIAVIVLSLIHAVNIFLPRTQPNSISQIKSFALFPNFSMRPVKRDSAYDILTLKTNLDNIVPEGQYLGILSYSDILNSEMLKNAEPSLNIEQRRVDYIANTMPYFDLNDINISPLCNANYMLVAFPAQTIRDDQKILEAAVDSFANWTDIATAYEELYEYETVIDDISIKLFHRVRTVSEYEQALFINKLRLMLN